MNKSRHIRITAVYAKLTALQEELTKLIKEEGEALDNLPEQFSESTRALEMQENIDIMDEVISQLKDAITSLKPITD